MSRRPAPGRAYLTGLFLLTGATEIVDAVSYLALGRDFTGNMTGNVLFVGFGAAGAGEVSLANNLLALGWLLTGHLDGPRLLLLTASLAVAMGAQAVAVRGTGVADVSTALGPPARATRSDRHDPVRSETIPGEAGGPWLLSVVKREEGTRT